MPSEVPATPGRPPDPDGILSGDLLPLVYEELRALARLRMAQERVGHTLQATALVHEVYARIGSDQRFTSRGQFFAAAAEAMRRILIEHARSKQRLKRGGRAKRQPLNVLDLAAEDNFEQIVAFDDAIRRLEEQTPTGAAVVRLRFYAGLTVQETADALGISSRTVDREWAYARAWLFRLMEDGPQAEKTE